MRLWNKNLLMSFANVLENAGVFKDDTAGNEGWQRFVDALK